MKPLAVDLCCGLGGWSSGLLAEGWDVVGFDVEKHEYGEERYPGQLVLQDIRTLTGEQFRGRVSLIVASPPCQKYSYMAMPWTKAKALQAWHRDPEHPERIVELNALFDACVRIGKEAQCPTIIENVRGAHPWVGRSRWMYGSFALWGDVPALMPMTFKGSKVPGFRFDGNGGSFQTASVEQSGVKVPGLNWSDRTRKGQAFNPAAQGKRLRDELEERSGRKQPGISGVRANGKGDRWFQDGAASHGSRSRSRKAASAMIAKIPLPLSRHIGKVFHP